MSNLLRVQWTIWPECEPRPWRACRHCAGPRPFQSSHRIRLNAHGKRLDAWLIYRCSVCGETWNRPLIERRPVRDFAPATLVALQTSDPALIRQYAFDLDALRRHTHRIDEPGAAIVRTGVTASGPGRCMALQIEMNVPVPSGLRLDRLLAHQLQISRSRLHALGKAMKLQITPGQTTMLNRPIRHGTIVAIDLADEADHDSIAREAVSDG